MLNTIVFWLYFSVPSCVLTITSINPTRISRNSDPNSRFHSQAESFLVSVLSLENPVPGLLIPELKGNNKSRRSPSLDSHEELLYFFVGIIGLVSWYLASLVLSTSGKSMVELSGHSSFLAKPADLICEHERKEKKKIRKKERSEVAEKRPELSQDAACDGIIYHINNRNSAQEQQGNFLPLFQD